jgi:protein maelstrom
MPQTNQENMEDAFPFFLLHVMQNIHEKGAAFIAEMAASAWVHMKPEEKSVHEERARSMKRNPSQVACNNRYDPRTTYYARNGRVQLRMTREIEQKVRALQRHSSLKTHPFHLVHVNYYCKHSSGRYLGCEIALTEFSFEDGIRKTYHAFINPGEIPIGYAFMAQKHTTRTHQIPLPPDAFGSMSDHQEILKNIKLFLMGNSENETKVPPLYTRPRDINAVVSVLRQLQGRPATYTKNAGRNIFRVYSASKLFNELRNASMGVPSNVILQPNFLNAYELDDYNFTEGISCNFHEKLDAMPHCSLSCVQRWSFLIMKECCGPLNINMIPGMHCALSSHFVKKVTVHYQGTRIRCWKRRNVMVENELKTQLCAKGNSHLQKQRTLWRPERSFPLKPLRRPRTTPTALKLRHASKMTEEDWDEVPAPLHNFVTPGPLPGMYSL